MNMENEIARREAEFAKKRDNLATIIHNWMADDEQNRFGTGQFSNPDIIDGYPETVLVEFEGETFAVTVTAA